MKGLIDASGKLCSSYYAQSIRFKAPDLKVSRSKMQRLMVK